MYSQCINNVYTNSINHLFVDLNDSNNIFLIKFLFHFFIFRETDNFFAASISFIDFQSLVVDLANRLLSYTIKTRAIVDKQFYTFLYVLDTSIYYLVKVIAFILFHLFVFLLYLFVFLILFISLSIKANV